MNGVVLTDRRPVARKPHTCGLCLRCIEPGTRYRFYTFAYDGTVYTHHEHEPCADLFYDEWWDGTPEDAPDPDDLLDELHARGVPMT